MNSQFVPSLRRVVTLAALCCSALRLSAADPISGNLSVTGNLDIQGNTAIFGTSNATTNVPGYLISYNNGTPASIDFSAFASSANWTWSQGTGNPQLRINSSNVLNLFNTSNATIGVTLNPAGDSSFQGGNVGIGLGNTAPTEKLDVAGNIRLSGNITKSGGGTLVLPGSGTLTLPSGGGTLVSNTGSQTITGNTTFAGNITLGGSTLATQIKVDSAGNVGIGTNPSSLKLDVAGDARVQNLTVTGQLSLSGTPLNTVTGGLTLSAGGTNQNITLTPSGTGNTFISSGKLKVGSSSTAPTQYLTIGNSSDAQLVGMDFYNAQGAGGSIAAGNSQLYFKGPTGGVAFTINDYKIRMNGNNIELNGGRISGNGNGGGLGVTTDNKVSIGSSNFTPLSALDVAGGVAAGSYAGTSAAPANGMIVSGNVGIGTSAPSTRLEVQGNTSDDSGGAFSTFNSDGTSLFYVRNDGNVGINNINPEYKLHVVGDTHSLLTVENSTDDPENGYSVIRLKTPGQSFQMTVGADGNTEWAGKWYVYNESNGGAGALVIDGNNQNRVGIGTIAPASKLTVVGVTDDQNDSALDVQNSWNDSLLFVRNDGNVGIGTPTPTEKLHVIGNATISGNLTVAGQPVVTANQLSGYATNAQVASLPPPAFTAILNKPTTLSGYGITDRVVANNAAGVNSLALGTGTSASNGATALGQSTVAVGSGSFAAGYEAFASGELSTAIGSETNASGGYSTAIGYGTNPSGYGSTAIGFVTSASGQYSTALGGFTSASGSYSTALGFNTSAQAFAAIVLGGYNSVQGNATAWVPTDDLVVVGNGSSANTRSNALTVHKNGNVRAAGTVQAKGGFRTPPMGDISMGDFHAGPNPAATDGTGLNAGLRYPTE